MTENERFEILFSHFSSLFPRACSTCGHRYETLKQYVLETTPVPGAVSYDAQLGDWAPEEPIGGIALAECSCGNTLGLSSEGIPLPQVHGILEWIQAECGQRRVTPTELLEGVRDRVRARALEDEAGAGAGEST